MYLPKLCLQQMNKYLYAHTHQYQKIPVVTKTRVKSRFKTHTHVYNQLTLCHNCSSCYISWKLNCVFLNLYGMIFHH